MQISPHPEKNYEILSIDNGATSDGREFQKLSVRIHYYWFIPILNRKGNRMIDRIPGIIFIWKDLINDFPALSVGDMINGEELSIDEIEINKFTERQYPIKKGSQIILENKILDNTIAYQEKLQDPLWIAKRHWIIRLDAFCCRKCNKSANTKPLRIHNIERHGQVLGLSAEFFDPKFNLVLENKLELHVHHKHYIIGKQPWEYEDDSLITLCPECHKQEHESKSIPIYSLKNEILSYCDICDRCQGSGYISEYKHVENGICFKCFGEGINVAFLY